MPISPTVSAWQAQMQSGGQSSADMSGMQLFKKTFSDQAFAALRSKFPGLVTFIVTFKIFDCDMEKGSAFGAFAISNGGDDIIYIPVVMVDGSIQSCEMVYIRSEDRFTPLTEDFVKRVISRNTSGDAKPMVGNAKVEDTRQLFRSIVRPPRSSHVVFAAADGVSNLPNRAKDAVRNYLSDHPELISKIAEFCSVPHLMESLQDSDESVYVHSPEVIRKESLSKVAASALTEEQQESIARRGFAVKDPLVETSDVFSLDRPIETEHNYVKYVPDSRPDCSAILGETVAFRGGELEHNPVVVLGKYLIFPDETPSYRMVDDTSSVVLSFANEKPRKSDLLDYGFFPAEELLSAVKKNDKGGYRLFALFPKKNGNWSLFHQVGNLGFDSSAYEEDGDIVIRDMFFGTVRVTKSITYGMFNSGPETILPWSTLFMVAVPESKHRSHATVSNFEDLRKYMQSLGTTLSVKKNGNMVDITDKNLQKSASFSNDADAYEFLQNGYGLSERQIDTVLNSKDSLLITKTAAPQGAVEVPAGKPVFQGSNLNTFASLGDKQVLDAGILASFAGDKDIKTLLVDYLPDFIAVLDKLGRVILKFTINKKQLEEVYGAERLGELMMNSRKVFTLVGELVSALQQYIRM